MCVVICPFFGRKAVGLQGRGIPFLPTNNDPGLL